MANFLNSVVNLGKAAMQRFQGPTDPNLVVVVNPNNMAQVPVVRRYECLVMYGPKSMKGQPNPIEVFEIVINSERGQCFSLIRREDKTELSLIFEEWKLKLPLLVDLDPSLCTIQNLQQYCDQFRKVQDFNVAQIAVVFDLRQIIPREEIKQFLDVGDGEGVTPLMLAIQRENAFMVNFLIAKKASLSTVDLKGNSPFHHAALTSKTIIDLLVVDPLPETINMCNKDGDTPLHMACKNDKPDCVQALLCCGADVNVTGTIDHESPIYSALKSSSARCVKEIIQMYPKQLHTHIVDLLIGDLGV